jgi:hypothetical protein
LTRGILQEASEALEGKLTHLPLFFDRELGEKHRKERLHRKWVDILTNSISGLLSGLANGSTLRVNLLKAC